MKYLALSILFSLSINILYAQKWNIEAPPGPVKKVSITTDEGTWMNLDVSPDGREIAFDVLNVMLGLIHAPVVCRVEPDFREITLGGRAQNEADHAAPL